MIVEIIPEQKNVGIAVGITSVLVGESCEFNMVCCYIHSFESACPHSCHFVFLCLVFAAITHLCFYPQLVLVIQGVILHCRQRRLFSLR